MKKIFSTKSFGIDFSLLLLRLGAGILMMVNHGYVKMSSFEKNSVDFSDPLGVSSPVSLSLTIFAEFFCSVLLALGLLTRLSLIPLIFTMCIAIFVIHWDDPFKKMESALIYLTIYLLIFFQGPGKFSIDKVVFK